MPRREDNHDICDLVIELLTDSGLATPHVDPRAGVSFAATCSTITAGDGWTVGMGIVGRHPVAGTTACPLVADTRREVHLESISHRSTDTPAVRALLAQLLRVPQMTAES